MSSTAADAALGAAAPLEPGDSDLLIDDEDDADIYDERAPLLSINTADLDRQPLPKRLSFGANTDAAGLPPASPTTLALRDRAVTHRDAPLQVLLRCSLLILCSIMCFGSQVAYDTAGAAAPIIRRTLHVDAEAIGDLYSAYHMPNTVMVILGGVFSDRVGTRVAACVFSGLVCAGTTVVAFTAPYSFRGMMFGRMLFGLGAESLNIVQISMLSKWFGGKHKCFPSLALSMAVAYSISAAGTVLAYDAVPAVGEMGGLGAAMWALGAFPCFLSMLSVFLLWALEWYVGVVDARETAARKALREAGSVQAAQREAAGAGVGEHVGDVAAATAAAESTAHGVAVDILGAGGAGGEGTRPGNAKSEIPGMVTKPALTLSQIVTGVGNFSSFFWTLIAYTILYFAASQVWNNFATDIFVERFELSPVDAGRINSISTALCVVMCPFLGVYVDLYGNTLWLCLAGTLLLAGGQVTLCWFARQYHSTAVLVSCELVIGTGMGMVQAALFPTLVAALPPHLVSTGMGITAAAQNSAMVLFPFITGFIHDRMGTYLYPMMLFVLQDSVCIVILGLLISSKMRQGLPVP